MGPNCFTKAARVRGGITAREIWNTPQLPRVRREGATRRVCHFPDEATGEQAMRRLLKNGNKYKNASIDDAMEDYAPKKENNTAAYRKFLLRVIGVSGTTLIRDLTPEQFEKLVGGIRRFEGWKVGKSHNRGSKD